MSNFWDLILLIASTFIFIAYLLVLFQIIVDLFRDPDMGGGSKVLWIIGLIFVPVLTSLFYILTRGRGMAARQRYRSAAGAVGRGELHPRSGGEIAGGSDRRRESACSTPERSTPTSSRASRPRRSPDPVIGQRPCCVPRDSGER